MFGTIYTFETLYSYYKYWIMLNMVIIVSIPTILFPLTFSNLEVGVAFVGYFLMKMLI